MLIYNANNSKELKDVIAFAQYDRIALSERKLVIIGIVDMQPTIVFGYSQCNTKLGKHVPQDKVTLIGLDGAVKAKYSSFDSELIYTTIDKMPMRKTELGRD